MEPTQKIARKLRRDLDKKIAKRKSNKVFKKDAKEIASTLNKKAREIAKTEKRKVCDVQKEILGYF